jgi:hypothetical protein
MPTADNMKTIKEQLLDVKLMLIQIIYKLLALEYFLCTCSVL